MTRRNGLPTGIDETFWELSLEDIQDIIKEALVSRRKKGWQQGYTIQTPTRLVTIMVQSESL